MEYNDYYLDSDIYGGLVKTSGGDFVALPFAKLPESGGYAYTDYSCDHKGILLYPYGTESVSGQMPPIESGIAKRVFPYIDSSQPGLMVCFSSGVTYYGYPYLDSGTKYLVSNAPYPSEFIILGDGGSKKARDVQNGDIYNFYPRFAITDLDIIENYGGNLYSISEDNNIAIGGGGNLNQKYNILITDYYNKEKKYSYVAPSPIILSEANVKYEDAFTDFLATNLGKLYTYPLGGSNFYGPHVIGPSPFSNYGIYYTYNEKYYVFKFDYYTYGSLFGGSYTFKTSKLKDTAKVILYNDGFFYTSEYNSTEYRYSMENEDESPYEEIELDHDIKMSIVTFPNVYSIDINGTVEEHKVTLPEDVSELLNTYIYDQYYHQYYPKLSDVCPFQLIGNNLVCKNYNSKIYFSYQYGYETYEYTGSQENKNQVETNKIDEERGIMYLDLSDMNIKKLIYQHRQSIGINWEHDPQISEDNESSFIPMEEQEEIYNFATDEYHHYGLDSLYINDETGDVFFIVARGNANIDYPEWPIRTKNQIYKISDGSYSLESEIYYDEYIYAPSGEGYPAVSGVMNKFYGGENDFCVSTPNLMFIGGIYFDINNVEIKPFYYYLKNFGHYDKETNIITSHCRAPEYDPLFPNNEGIVKFYAENPPRIISYTPDNYYSNYGWGIMVKMPKRIYNFKTDTYEYLEE